MTASGKRIRVATVGTWGHYVHVLAEIVPLARVQLVGHARSMPDDDVKVVHRHTKDESVPWFENYSQMLRDVRPDVVIVSTRIDRINPLAIEAATAGCHVICEKPLAIEHAALGRLWDTCTVNQVQCISMLGNGRHPVMQAAAGIIRSGGIGDVVLLNARKSYQWGTRPEWFSDRKYFGTTASWIGIHGLEMIHLLSGQEFTSVAAMQSNRVHTERKACQDNGVIQLSLSGGGHASVSFDYLRPTAAAGHGDDWVRVVGSRGIIEAGLDRNRCTFLSNDEPEHDVPLPAAAPYYELFLDSLSQTHPSDEMRRAFMLTHTCLCANDSADRQTVETITPMRMVK